MFKKLFQNLFGESSAASPFKRPRTGSLEKPNPLRPTPEEISLRGDPVYRVIEVAPRTNTAADAFAPETMVTLWRTQQPSKSATYYALAGREATPAHMLEASLAVYWMEYFISKKYNHNQVHDWLMRLKRDTGNFYGGGAVRDEEETVESLSKSIQGLVRAALHFALSHPELIESHVSTTEYQAFKSSNFTKSSKNNEERITQINNFHETEHAGKIDPILIEHFKTALESLELLRKLLNNPSQLQSVEPVIERRIHIYSILQDRNFEGQNDVSKILIVGNVYRTICAGEKERGYELKVAKGMAKIDMIEGLSAFYWDEVLEQEEHAMSRLWTGLERLAIATSVKFYKPTEDDTHEKQRTAILAELTRVTLYYLWGTLHFHDASLVSMMYREGLQRGWLNSPVQNRRIREQAPMVAAAIHRGDFDPDFAAHVIKSSRFG
jgi:hypothetical protein